MNSSFPYASLVSFLVTFLLDATWQIPLCFAAAALAAYIVRHRSAVCIHRVWTTALIAQAALPVTCAQPWVVSPFRWLWRSALPQNTAAVMRITMGPGTTIRGLHLPVILMLVLTILYLGSLLFFGLRLALRVQHLVTLRRHATSVELKGEPADLWRQVSATFGVQGAVLWTSPEVHGPQTVGVLRQVLLLPAGLLNQLSPRELRAMFAHECAHMQRQDFTLNLLYEALGVLIAFHPCFWLTRHALEESREWVCDEAAVRGGDPPQTYARSLLAVASLLAEPLPATVPNAIGMFRADAYLFERRLMRLTFRPSPPTVAVRTTQLVLCTLLGMGTCGSAWALRSGRVLPAVQGATAPNPPTIAGGVMAGTVLTRVNPVYPPDARAAHIQGTVVLHAIIDRDGTISSLEAVSGPPELTEASLTAVRQWTYKPYELNGEPVEVQTTITVNFNLDPEEK